MSGWWVHEAWNAGQTGPVLLVSWAVWVIGSITLHELAHGWAALRRGDGTPVETGHMTWNPLVHMGPWSLVMFAVIGIAWGQMPVNPGRMRGRRAEAFVAAAGPAMNLLLAVACVVGAALWIRYAAGVANPLRENMALFLITGAWLNLVLMAFNLIPVPPLDGGTVLSNFSPRVRSFYMSENGMWIGLGIFVLAFWFAGGVLFQAARATTTEIVTTLVSVMP